MALNPLIPLSINVADTTAAAANFGRSTERLGKSMKGLAEKKKSGGDIKEFNERDKARVQSLVTGAGQLKPLLESEDIPGAMQFLARRAQNLSEAGIDSSDTREMMQIVAQDPQKAMRVVNDTLSLGERMGFIKSSGMLSPEEEAQQLRLKRAGATSVNIDTKGAQKEAEKLAELRASRLGAMQETALQAEEQNMGLTQLENIDVQTGFGEEAKGQLARVFNSFGVDGTALTGVDPANMQAFNAVSGKLTLDVMSTQKGPQTDRDRDFIARTLPNIKNEALANNFTVNSLKALNYRRIEMRDFYENYLEENGTLKGSDIEWNKFKQKTPLISEIIKNPETGLPMFFHEFKRKLIERNPTATEQQVIDAWRELN